MGNLHRIAIVSDLHVDEDPWDFSPEGLSLVGGCDALVVAGDVSDDHCFSIRWIGERFPHLPVFFVFGNHEDRGSASREVGRARARCLAWRRYPNIHFLDREVHDFRGVLLMGCTLWVDFESVGKLEENMARAERINPDHRDIRTIDPPGTLTPALMRDLHLQDRKWLIDALERSRGRPKVVVTHYPPLLKSVMLDASAATVASIMASDLPFLFEYEGTGHWIHGHLHHRCDYMISHTRVLANPRGAPPYMNRQFNEFEVIEVRGI